MSPKRCERLRSSSGRPSRSEEQRPSREARPRTPSPLSRITGFSPPGTTRFAWSLPAHYQLWHHSEIHRTGRWMSSGHPFYPQGTKSADRSGAETEPVSPYKHMSLSHARLPRFRHLGIKYRRRELNPQDSVFEADAYSNSATPA